MEDFMEDVNNVGCDNKGIKSKKHIFLCEKARQSMKLEN